ALAEVGVRQTDHRALDDAGQRVDLGLHLLRIDVEAAGDDQVLAAADDVDVAVGVDHAQVAGDEVAVGAELGGGLLGLAPVAGEDVGAPALDHADLARRRLAAGGGIGDAQSDARQRVADRAGPALAVVGVGGVHPRLGHAVALQDRRPGPPRPFVVG